MYIKINFILFKTLKKNKSTLLLRLDDLIVGSWVVDDLTDRLASLSCLARLERSYHRKQQSTHYLETFTIDHYEWSSIAATNRRDVMRECETIW